MINYLNKPFLNLEEQVEQNAHEIDALKKSGIAKINYYGANVSREFDSAADFEEWASTHLLHDYGESVAVIKDGKTHIYVWVNDYKSDIDKWTDIGTITITVGEGTVVLVDGEAVALWNSNNKADVAALNEEAARATTEEGRLEGLIDSLDATKVDADYVDEKDNELKESIAAKSTVTGIAQDDHWTSITIDGVQHSIKTGSTIGEYVKKVEKTNNAVKFTKQDDTFVNYEPIVVTTEKPSVVHTDGAVRLAILPDHADHVDSWTYLIDEEHTATKSEVAAALDVKQDLLTTDSEVTVKSVTMGSKTLDEEQLTQIGDAIDTLLTSKLDASKCTLTTVAPTAAITDGGVHIVVLTSEPTTKYDGYIYLIG